MFTKIFKAESGIGLVATVYEIGGEYVLVLADTFHYGVPELTVYTAEGFAIAAAKRLVHFL